MVKFTPSPDRTANVTLLAGAILGCVTPTVSKLLAKQPLDTNDFMTLFGCLAGLLTGNVARRKKIPLA